MANTQRTTHSGPSRNAVLLGLAVGAGGLATGCDAPETGSLENVKKGGALKPAPVDYKKLDYNKIDYNKIDYSKIDYNKLDPEKVTLNADRLAKVAEANVKLVSSKTLADESMRRLVENKAFIKDPKVVAQIDSIIESMKSLNSIIGEDMRW